MSSEVSACVSYQILLTRHCVQAQEQVWDHGLGVSPISTLYSHREWQRRDQAVVSVYGLGVVCDQVHAWESNGVVLREVEQYFSGIVVLQWYCGIGVAVVLWCCSGIVVLQWYCGVAVVLWCCSGIVVLQWYCGVAVVLWCCSGIVVVVLQWWCCSGL